jgi:hypothetical protein
MLANRVSCANGIIRSGHRPVTETSADMTYQTPSKTVDLQWHCSEEKNCAISTAAMDNLESKHYV